MVKKTSHAILKPSIHTPIWSGSRLSEMYRSYRSYESIGEAWLTSVEEGSESTAIIDGKYINLSEALEHYHLSAPPLIKLLDAYSPLSIQVHPDDIAASKHGGVSKTEMWYVLSADPEAEIIYGSKEGVTAEELRGGIRSGKIEHLLRRVPVHPGEVFMIPHGMIHSLGAGVTVLEVQDRAGTTYRVKDISGNRETHPEESADSVRVYSPSDAELEAFSDPYKLRKAPLPGETLASTHGFGITRFASQDSSVDISVDHNGVYVFCEKGGGLIEDTAFERGDSLFITSPTTISLHPESALIFVI